MELKEVGCEGIYVAQGRDRYPDNAAAQTSVSVLQGSLLLSS